MNPYQSFLDTILQQGLEEGCFPSGCGAIGRGRQVLAQTCVGRVPLPDGQPADKHTLYDMASMSKILGPTMLALKAVENGEIHLQDHLSDYFDNVPEDKKAVTVYMLMTHTAGFEPAFWLSQYIASPEDAARCILDHPLAGVPGEKPMYSCMGYILLGKLLEKRYGEPLKDLARERVFTPLGMTHTGYCPTPDAGVFAATEDDPETGRPIIGVVHDENARFLQGNSGNAGVFMPLCDGVRFTSMLSLMGATGVPMSASEQYSAMQQGVVDGAETNPFDYVSKKYYEVCPVFSYTQHMYDTNFIVVATATVEAMSEEDQAIFWDLMKDAAAKEFEEWDAAIDSAFEMAKDKDITWVEDVDRDAFAANFADFQQEIANRSEGTKKIYDAIMEAA